MVSTTRVTRIASDSDYGTWEITVTRDPASHRTTNRAPKPHDVPLDVLLALREWLAEIDQG